MNVFYEEDGTFKTGAILTDNTTSLQIESSHGKRSKIKANAVLLKFDAPSLPLFMEEAQKIAADIDLEFLWECCGSDEFPYESLAKEYFGHSPDSLQNAGILIRLHHSPVYFYKKGKGRYKAAPPDALKAALASIEKKRVLAQMQADFVAELVNLSLPKEFEPLLPSLLYDPDKNSVAFKAIEEAASQMKLSPVHLLEKCGAISSSHDYHFNRFFFEHFPKGIHPPAETEPFSAVDLPLSDAQAFSIDDSSTTEIDDAFSVSPQKSGHCIIGIHIAAPSLGIFPGSSADSFARQMLSTVYIPGQKITMLPEWSISTFTLAEEKIRPVVSLYLEVSPNYEIIQIRNAVEKIKISANLRHDSLEDYLAEDGSVKEDHPFSTELHTLFELSKKLEALRGKMQALNQVDYSFSVQGDRIEISERKRGSPIDKIVSELMIYANTEWGRQLSQADFMAIYRTQNNGKVRQDVAAAPHQGLGVAQYSWASSPLRRYVDMINQRQLVSLIQGNTPYYPKGSDDMILAMRDFEEAYEIYANFQRTMERYWSLRWLIQEGIDSMEGSVLRENLVKLDRVPLFCKVPSLPEMEAGSRVLLSLSDIDLLDLGFNARFIGSHEKIPA